MQSDTAVGNYSDGTNQQAKARRSHPAQHGEGFDAPPTIKRSGSEHRRAVTSLALLERARAWEWVKDPLFARGGQGSRGDYVMNIEEKKADFMRRFKASRERKAEYVAQMEKRMRDDYRSRTGKEAESFCVL